MAKYTLADYQRIKILALTAIFTDDDLLDRLVLKGGNAVDLVYQLAKRASLDLDLSLGGDLDKAQAAEFKEKIERAVNNHFEENGYKVIDWDATDHPPEGSTKKPSFWGGYQIKFKVVSIDDFEKYQHDENKLRLNAIPVAATQQKKLEIDISKFEYTGENAKTLEELGEYQIYVYTPLTLVFGKLRALCQQTEEYYAQIGRDRSPNGRSRDFFDMYHLLESKLINRNDLCTSENLMILQEIFKCKKVGFKLLDVIPNHRDMHEKTWQQVQDTVYSDVELKDFKFYYDYIIEWIEELKECLKNARMI